MQQSCLARWVPRRETKWWRSSGKGRCTSLLLRIWWPEASMCLLASLWSIMMFPLCKTANIEKAIRKLTYTESAERGVLAQKESRSRCLTDKRIRDNSIKSSTTITWKTKWQYCSHQNTYEKFIGRWRKKRHEREKISSDLYWILNKTLKV